MAADSTARHQRRRNRRRVGQGGGKHNSLTASVREGPLGCLIHGLRHREIFAGTPRSTDNVKIKYIFIYYGFLDTCTRTCILLWV